MSSTIATASPRPAAPDGAPTRYTRVAVFLHWTIAALIIAQLVGGIVMHKLPNSVSFKFEAYQMHKSFGLVVLALSLVRLAWRLTHRPPALSSDHAAWERVLARITHVGFYVLMIAVPLAGWAMISNSPFPSPLFLSPIEIPKLPVGGSADLWAEVHEYLAFGILGLLGLHVAGALKHHYVDKDGTLARMATWVRKPIGTLR